MGLDIISHSELILKKISTLSFREEKKQYSFKYDFHCRAAFSVSVPFVLFPMLGISINTLSAGLIDSCYSWSC